MRAKVDTRVASREHRLEMGGKRTGGWTRQRSAVAWLAVFLLPVSARAGNSDEVNAGVDVTLTGGAVVASTYTGAALWYNPAGIARIKKASLEITGITFQTQIVRVPGFVTIGTDPPTESDGNTVNFTVIPEAITFTIVLKERLKLGIGLFDSSIRRSLTTGEETTPPDISPEVKIVVGRRSRLSFYHASGGLAATLGEKKNLWVGGALDFVVGNSRIEATQAFAYDEGDAGFFTSGEVSVRNSYGLQLKAGLQWAPMENVRLGLSVATPTYAFVLTDRSATTVGQSPPMGAPPPPDGASSQAAGGAEQRGVRGGWWGVEPGNTRVGVAYVDAWGWIEVDLVFQWRLRTPELGIDLQTTVNVRAGSAFRLSRFVKLGVGAFTDRSPIDRLQLTRVATADVDFYGVHLGFLFSNREVHPDRPDVERKDKRESVGLSFAIGLRYAFGRGDVLGLFVPPEYDPSAFRSFPTRGKIHELSLNLGAKVLF